MTNTAATHSLEDIRFFQRIAAEIRTHKPDYRYAGKWLDGKFGNEATLRKQNQRIAALRSRKQQGERLHQHEHRRLGLRKRSVKARAAPFFGRFHMAVRLIILRPLEVPTPDEARRILLLAWLLTDREAHEAGLGLTEFEDWPWETENPTGLGRRYALEWLRSEEAEYNALLGFARLAWDVVRDARRKSKETERGLDRRRSRMPIPKEVMERLREIPAKSETHRKAKVLAWKYRKRSSEEIARHIETETELKIGASRARQLRGEAAKWVYEGTRETLTPKQTATVQKILNRVRKVYRAFPSSFWDENKKDVRQEITTELLCSGEKEAETAAKKLLDDKRRDLGRVEDGINPETRKPYEDLSR